MKTLNELELSELLTMEKSCALLKDQYMKSANLYRGKQPQDMYESLEFNNLMKKYNIVNTIYEDVIVEIEKRVREYEKTDK